MRKLLTLIAMVAIIFSSVSSAYAFDLGGYVGKVLVKLTGYANGTPYQQGTDQEYWQDPNKTIPGDGQEDGWGVGLVTDIYKINANGTKGDRIWQDGVGNESLAYYYYGIDDWKVNTVDPNKSYIYSTNGTLDIYSRPYNSLFMDNLNANQRVGNTFTGITDQTQFAEFNFVPGIKAGDGITTISEKIASPEFPDVFANGSALGAVVPGWGAWGSKFDNNLFENGSDLSIGFTVSYNPGVGDNNFYFSVDDPARTAVTPEPVSSALFLIGGVALAARHLRRKKS